MRIVHIAPNSPYNDYWGYQDNLLPKYQKKLGHEVTIIVPNLMHENGSIVQTNCADYRLNDGVRVIRLSRVKRFLNILTTLSSKLDVYELLKELEPDFIFFHGLVSDTIFDAIKYKKNINQKCVIVQDNHLDYNIGFDPKTLKGKILRAYYRRKNKKSISYVDKVYGVTPWRMQYAKDFFGIPDEKLDVLIMGADDEKIDFSNRETIRNKIREQNNVSDDEFLIVTGGKIDSKKKIHILMKACSDLKNIKLLVFGNINDDVKNEFEDILNSSTNIVYVGWINSDKVYDYFFAADLVFFPGQHSVLWEQACASKVPCVFERWEKMEHINNGGNSDFVSPVTEETIKEKIQELHNTEKYEKMKTVAFSEKTDIYLYSNIAKKSLECVKTENETEMNK